MLRSPSADQVEGRRGRLEATSDIKGSSSNGRANDSKSLGLWVRIPPALPTFLKRCFLDNEKSNESAISLCFVVAGFLGYLLVSTLLEVFAGMFGSVAQFRNIQVVQHGLPVAVGIAVFFIFVFE